MIFAIQALIFVVGVILLILDGSGGYFENMTVLSYLGMFFCALGVGFYHLVGLIGGIFKKKKK